MAKATSWEGPLHPAADHDVLSGTIQGGLQKNSGSDHEGEVHRPAVSEGQPLRCPECHSIVYSRRHQLCGVCAHPLPFDYLFSPTESLRIDFLLQSERQRHKNWLARTGGA